MPMVRIDKVALTEDLVAFEGRYYSEELETLLVVKLEDDELTVHHIRMEPFTLNHNSGDDFTAPFPFGSIAFKRSGNGQIRGLMAANGRTKDVWFKRQ